MPLLDSVNSPDDVRRMSFSELKVLSEEIRGLIIETVSRNGGHLASNLGVVELTLALHRVFRTPEDSIIWDVGHQCYTHKLITGRRDSFPGLRRLGGISGFPKRSESEHDIFDTGHASTSISTALGILEARKFKGEPGSVVAVIGDGALNGGMAFEALNHAGQSMLPLIVILNDNKMSISPVVGSLSLYLSRVSATVRYQTFRSVIDRTVRSVPRFGPRLFALMMRWKRSVKALLYKENLFSEFGFEYIGPLDGHDIPAMTEILGDVRRLGRPCVVHVVTHKGRGHSDAEEDPANFHGMSPRKSPVSIPAQPAYCPDSREHSAALSPRTFTEAFSAAIVDMASRNCDIVAVTAAMSKGTGLEAFKSQFPQRFHDVGIAEQHAVTYAAGLAAGGLLPVVAIYSTFLQRAVDQVFHDVALQGLHVVFAVDRTGLVPDDGETHQGIYDLSMFRSLPGMSMLAPASGADLALCLRWAADATGPVMVRYPKTTLPPENPAFSQPVERGRGVFLRRSGKSGALVLAAGILATSALDAALALEELGFEADVYSLRFVAPLDADHIARIAEPYSAFLSLEENAGPGGIGESLASIIAPGRKGVSFVMKSLPSSPLPQGTREELLAMSGMAPADILKSIRECCLSVRSSPEVPRVFPDASVRAPKAGAA